MNFDGPVRVASTAGSGSATITLSFANWKGAKVAPTTHSVVVAPAIPGPKEEPVAKELIATLIHPERKATIHTLQFSKDGKRLFATGYPSGIIQVWDWSAKKELRRIDTPPGLRGTWNYTALSPDWKTLYVPIESRKITSSEKDGKVVQRVDYSGRIGVWDLSTGEERTPLCLPDGSASDYATLSPDGQTLVAPVQLSFTAGEPRAGELWAWDLQTGERRKLLGNAGYPQFSPDSRTVAVTASDWEATIQVLKLIDLASGKEQASFRCPVKGAMMLTGSFSPDGSLILAEVRPGKGSKPMILFLDGKTLAERGRFEGEIDPDGYGWLTGTFTPDGKSCVALDMAGKAHVWDVAAQNEIRSFEVGAISWKRTFSPDGKTFAVAWAPKRPAELEGARNIDPRDLTQPRVTLFDLAGKKPPRTLIAPHGFPGAVAFSPDGRILAFGTTGGVRLFDLTR